MSCNFISIFLNFPWFFFYFVTVCVWRLCLLQIALTRQRFFGKRKVRGSWRCHSGQPGSWSNHLLLTKGVSSPIHKCVLPPSYPPFPLHWLWNASVRRLCSLPTKHSLPLPALVYFFLVDLVGGLVYSVRTGAGGPEKMGRVGHSGSPGCSKLLDELSTYHFPQTKGHHAPM